MNTSTFVQSGLRELCATVAPYALLDRMLRPAVLVGYYHMISDAEVPHIKHLYRHKTVAEFMSDLGFVLRRYTPIGLGALIDAAVNGTPLPPRSFHLTFDDGFSEMASVVAPILKARGIPATFFISSAFVDNRELCYLQKASLLAERVCTGSVSPTVLRRLSAALEVSPTCARPGAVLGVTYQERQLLDEAAAILEFDFDEYLRTRQPYLTERQVRALVSEGFTIGAHSIDHPRYSTLSTAEQLRQTLESVRYLKTRFALPYAAFAFPHSDDGVSTEFFAKLRGAGGVDITFGTGGLLEDTSVRNIQRVNFEKPLWPARKTMRYHLTRGLYKRALGQGRVRRS